MSVECEHDMQEDYHDWDVTKHCTTLSGSSAIDGVSRGGFRKVKKLGYMKGTLDYRHDDPRIKIEFLDDGRITVRVIPWFAFDFKRPEDKAARKKAGKPTAEQKRVAQNMVQRGAIAFFTDDVEQTKEAYKHYRKAFHALYKGKIIIDPRRKKVTYPKRPRMVALPGREKKARDAALRRIEARKRKREKKKKPKVRRASRVTGRKRKRTTKRRKGPPRKRRKTSH